MEHIIGVVADDLTGANDVGSMFAKTGCETHVAALPWRGGATPEVLVIDTDSRYETSQQAYVRTAEATRTLQALGFSRFYKKTCSVFRGNVGAELDAMADEIGADMVIVVPGYPRNNRRTLHGVMYVGDMLLEDSFFRHDPVHPTTRSNLVDVLQAQTRHRVELIDTCVVRDGATAVREAVCEARRQARYVMIDAGDQEALRTIAEATQDEHAFCGSAGLAEELAPLWFRGASAPRDCGGPPKKGAGVLVVSGSLSPVTLEQTERLLRDGAALVELAASVMENASERIRLAGEAASWLRAGRNVVIRTATNRIRGSDAVLIARRLSEALAEVAADIVAVSGADRLVTAGGDTAAAVCRRLGITAHRVCREIETGLPLCRSLTGPPMLMVLKAGSMGSPDFLARAVAELRES